MAWEFELVAGPYGGTTEGPAWDGQALLFTHIPGSRIMRYDPNTGACTEFRTGTNSTNGLMFDAQGRLYGCQSGNHCIARFEPDGKMTQLPNRLDGRRHNRPNDLAIDRKGRIWFTDPFGRGRPREERELDHASILRLDPQADGSWTLTRMTYDTTSPNGILFSQDERTLYVAQSDYDGVRELRAYPPAGGRHPGDLHGATHLRAGLPRCAAGRRWHVPGYRGQHHRLLRLA
jgi:gluconolactonase